MSGGRKKKNNKKDNKEVGLNFVESWSNIMEGLGEIEGARAEAFASPLPGDQISNADSRFFFFIDLLLKIFETKGNAMLDMTMFFLDF